MKLLASAALLLASVAAHAHGSAEVSELEREIGLLLPLFVSGVWYAVGLWRLHAHTRAGSWVVWRRAFVFFLGWGAIVASLLTPLHELGRHSFTAHMIEHELLMLIAAPLLALSKPIGVFLWALPKPLRVQLGYAGHRPLVARSWQALTAPLVVTVLQAIALWVWHVPVLFDRALQSENWHIAQHVSFLVTALLFWWGITRAPKAGQGYGLAALYLFITALHTGVLGALMSFSTSPWYRGYAALDLGEIPFGLTQVEDQQLAGLIMWIPGGLVHAAAALAYVALWLRRMDAMEVSRA